MTVCLRSISHFTRESPVYPSKLLNIELFVVIMQKYYKYNVNQNKSRLRSRMTDSHLCEVLRVSTTKLSPDIPAILQSKGQHHCSH